MKLSSRIKAALAKLNRGESVGRADRDDDGPAEFPIGLYSTEGRRT